MILHKSMYTNKHLRHITKNEHISLSTKIYKLNISTLLLNVIYANIWVGLSFNSKEPI